MHSHLLKLLEYSSVKGFLLNLILPKAYQAFRLQDHHAMAFVAISALAVAGVAKANPIKPTLATDFEPTQYTATVDTAVYDAQATAPTSSFRKHYKNGRAFDRFITIWMEVSNATI